MTSSLCLNWWTGLLSWGKTDHSWGFYTRVHFSACWSVASRMPQYNQILSTLRLNVQWSKSKKEITIKCLQNIDIQCRKNSRTKSYRVYKLWKIWYHPHYKNKCHLEQGKLSHLIEQWNGGTSWYRHKVQIYIVLVLHLVWIQLNRDATQGSAIRSLCVPKMPVYKQWKWVFWWRGCLNVFQTNWM